MRRQARRATIALMTAALVLPIASTAAGAVTDGQRASAGAAYVSAQQRPNGSIPAFSPIGSTADAVVAFVAAGTERPAMREAIGYLNEQVRRGKVTMPGLLGKVAQAVEASGRNPRSFAGQNLVELIRSLVGPDGRIGGAAVFDQALAILGLEAAGAKPPAAATQWLLDAQCPSGGWSYDEPYQPGTDDESCFDGTATDFFTADTNTTSYVVMALEAAGQDAYAADPFAFFRSARDGTHRGWEYAPGFGTDSNSTALVIQAHLAAGRRIPAGGREALRALQPRLACGAWAYSYDGAEPGDPNLGATIGAVPAAGRAPLPVAAGEVGPPKATSRC